MTERVSIQLAGREFHLSCEPEEREGLLEAASFLDARMKKLRSASSAPGFDRLAVLAAIQITHEYLEADHQETQKNDTYDYSVERLQHLRSRLEKALQDAPEPL